MIFSHKEVAMEKGRISVVLPCYNVAKWLDDCFKSLEDQTYKKTEYIFVNDGSSDNTLDKIKTFCKGKKNCKIIDKPNGGLCSARNAGIDVAEGEYLCFIDPDDFVSPRFFEVLFNLIEEYKTDCAVCWRKKVEEDFHYEDIKEEDEKPQTKTICGGGRILDEYMIKDTFDKAVWNKIYRLEKVLQIKNQNRPYIFDEGIRECEDTEFCFQFLKTVDKIVFRNETLYYYRQRAGSILHSEFSPKQLDRMKWNYVVIKEAEKDFPSVAKYARQRLALKALGLSSAALKKEGTDKETLEKLAQALKSNIKYIQNKFLYINYLFVMAKLKKRLKGV